MSTLTPREREIVALVAEGLTNREIAARVGCTSRTVAKHLENVYTKVGKHSRTELAVEAVRSGAVA